MSLLDIDSAKQLDYSSLDSFVIYIALSGNVTINADGNTETLADGELVLIPAECCDVEIEGEGRIMEVYIK